MRHLHHQHPHCLIYIDQTLGMLSGVNHIYAYFKSNQMNSSFEKINSWDTFFDCVRTLEHKENILFLGWKELDTHRPFVFYKFEPVVGRDGSKSFWTFQFDSNFKKGVITHVPYPSQGNFIQIESLKEFKSVINEMNQTYYPSNQYVDSKAAMDSVKQILDASSYNELLSPNLVPDSNETQLCFLINRLYDITTITIGFEKKIEYVSRNRVNFFYVTRTTKAESESLETITETETLDSIINAVDALQAVIKIKESMLLVPDAPRSDVYSLEHVQKPTASETKEYIYPGVFSHDLLCLLESNFEFKNSFICSKYYETRAFSNPYVHITIVPNSAAKHVDIIYQHGQYDSSQSVKEKKQSTLQYTVKNALSTLNACSRIYLIDATAAMNNLESRLHAERKDILFKRNTKIFTLKIRNGAASAVITYKSTASSPLFTCEITRDQTTSYKCYHPETVMLMIRTTISDIDRAKHTKRR